MRWDPATLVLNRESNRSGVAGYFVRRCQDAAHGRCHEKLLLAEQRVSMLVYAHDVGRELSSYKSRWHAHAHAQHVTASDVGGLAPG